MLKNQKNRTGRGLQVVKIDFLIINFFTIDYIDFCSFDRFRLKSIEKFGKIDIATLHVQHDDHYFKEQLTQSRPSALLFLSVRTRPNSFCIRSPSSLFSRTRQNVSCSICGRLYTLRIH